MAFNLPKLFSGAKDSGDQTVMASRAPEARSRDTNRTASSGAKSPVSPPITRQLQILGAVLLALLVIVGVLVYRDYRMLKDNAAYIATVGDLRMLSQRLAKGASPAAQSDFKMLRDSHNKFASGLKRLRDGGELDGASVPPSPENVAPFLDRLAQSWTITEKNVSQLLKAEAGTAAFEQAGANIFANTEGLLEAANALASAYQPRSTERTIYEVSLAALILLVLAVLAMMYKISLDDARLQTELARRIAQESEKVAQESEKVAQESERVNRQNQDAILRLMNELSDLADGDLTVTATVSEDITGAIADSINYTIEELRVLVGRINDAAGRVTSATEIAQRTSAELLDAAHRQSLEIQEAGHSVLEVASSMTRVSGDADQSARVARQSLAAAGKGNQAVQDSIKGMNEIRGQIQETSKRIKRLGESSQEIGEIVELISDITEQTNVLALNAAIQAASAGDAGRGFTVVAEEVQRLAERSGEATKQIAAIVKTIQSDTQGAILAMEESTHDVVEGAKLSDAAGQALAEIGTVSQNLSELIKRFSDATRRQADAATGVAGKMQGILKVTEQTTVGTQRTAAAVGELAGLATELKSSVAGFKVG
jgi:twitching motility protein PilJ